MGGKEVETKDAIDSQRLFYPWNDVDERSPTDALLHFWRKTKKKTREATQYWTPWDWAAFVIPAIGWLRTYKWRRWLIHDLIAGISVGFMVVPQGISYANSAGLPAAFGLYGAFLPCLVYSFMGTSRQLAVGPVAVTSLLISSNLKSLIPCSQAISNPNSITDPGQIACQAQYNQAAVQLAFIVACLYTGMGILRLGWLIKLLSHAVISGFTTGAAITIGLGQVKYILGYSITMGSSTRLQDYLSQYFMNLRLLRWQEFILGVTSLYILIAFKFSPRLWAPLRHFSYFGALFVAFMGIAAVYIGQINTPDRGGISIVASIPAGLPSFTGTEWSPMTGPTSSDLFPIAVVVMFVDLLESTSIARALARKNGYELIYNREMFGLGLANFAGAMSNAYTTTGSFSRSAVNNNAGARTPLAQFVCGWVVGFVLIFLTSFFQNVPFSCIAAIVIAAVATLVDLEHGLYLWRVSFLDWLCWMASCMGCLFYSVEVGLAIAVGLAILLVLYHTAFPHTAVLGKVAGTSDTNAVYRNVKQYPDSQLIPGVLAFRVDAPFYFANAKSLEEKLEKALVKFTAWSSVQGVPKVHFIILDMTAVHYVDAMGLHFLEDLVFETKKKGMALLLANPTKQVVRMLTHVKLPELVGKEFVFVTMSNAMAFAQQKMSDVGYTPGALAYATSGDIVKPQYAALQAVGIEGSSSGGSAKDLGSRPVTNNGAPAPAPAPASIALTPRVGSDGEPRQSIGSFRHGAVDVGERSSPRIVS